MPPDTHTRLPSSERARRRVALALLLGISLLIGVSLGRGSRAFVPWASGRPELYFRTASGQSIALDAVPKR